MLEQILGFSQIIIADLVLSGDNALVIGMAAASLAPDLRKKAILYGMVIAALLRIVFAIIATKLLGIPGIYLIGSVLLFWVCWRLYREIRDNIDRAAEEALEHAAEAEGPQDGNRNMTPALVSITIADVSMSLDNVLAVAAIADGDTTQLVFGLSLAIVLMAFAATLIMRLLTRYPWISWLGLAVLLYVSADMLYRGLFDPTMGVLALLK